VIITCAKQVMFFTLFVCLLAGSRKKTSTQPNITKLVERWHIEEELITFRWKTQIGILIQELFTECLQNMFVTYAFIHFFTLRHMMHDLNSGLVKT